METTTTTTARVNVALLLSQMAHGRPDLNPRDYITDWRDDRGRKAYNRERAEISRDLRDFEELIRNACNFYSVQDLNERLTEKLTNTGNRLHLTADGRLRYDVGQYYPTEYRPACSRVLASVIWEYLYHTYPNKHPRESAKRYFSRRVLRNYFN